MQLKTVLHEVYTYVLNEIFFKKQCIFKVFVQNPCFVRLHLCTKGDFCCLFSSLFGNCDLWAIGTFGQLGPSGNWDLLGNWDIRVNRALGNGNLWVIGTLG